MTFASPGPIAFSLGLLTVGWYGLLLALAAVVGLLLARREAARRGEPMEPFLTACSAALAGGIIGARLYHMAFHWDYYGRAPLKALALWEGGVGIFGGIAGGVLAAALCRWLAGRSLAQFLDIVAPSLVLGQAIGRWGNFFNEEAFGAPTGLPWGMHVSAARRPAGFEGAEFFHPTFLYESLWAFAVFLLLVRVLRRRLETKPGALFLAYLALYSAGRLPIEALRLDSEMLGPYRSAHVVALGCLITAGLGLGWLHRRRAEPVAVPAVRVLAGARRGGRTRWLVAGAVLGLVAAGACTLELSGLGPGTPTDPAFRGCFERAASDAGLIVIVQAIGDNLHGRGSGLLGPAGVLRAEDGWAFDGRVTALGQAQLNVNLAGGGRLAVDAQLSAGTLTLDPEGPAGPLALTPCP